MFQSGTRVNVTACGAMNHIWPYVIGLEVRNAPILAIRFDMILSE